MKLRTWLEGELRKLPGITVGLWKDTDLMCVFYRGKELAHFHDHEEIDVRLSQRFMKREKIEAFYQTGHDEMAELIVDYYDNE